MKNFGLSTDAAAYDFETSSLNQSQLPV